MDHLVSRVEIAELLGVTQQRIYQLLREEGFPAPLATLAIGQVWDRDVIIAWARSTGRLPYDD